MRIQTALLLVPLSVVGQSAMPTEFPADAVSVSGDALRAQLSGKVYTVKPAQGGSWRLEYKSNGFIFLETNQGFRDTGTWRVDGDKLCGTWQRSQSGCSDARVKGDVVYVKRISNAEVIALIAE